MVEHVDTARDAMIGGLGSLQASFGSDIHTLAKGLEVFEEQLQEDRIRDQAVLGKALGNIAAGLSLMSSAVMETRMVFPEMTSIDAGTHSKDVTCAPNHKAEGANDKVSTPFQPPTRPSTLPVQPQSSPAARVFAALKRAGEVGPPMFTDPLEAAPASKSGSTAVRSGVRAETTSEFMLEKDHHTVDALWREYDAGVLGRKSVRAMLEEDLKKSECQRKR